MNAVHGIDDPAGSAVSPEHASRRTFLKGIGVAGAASLAAPLLASESASAATPAGRLIYGINNENYPAFTADNPKGFQYSYRAYDDNVWESVKDVPTSWISAHPTNFVNWSVRPNLSLLLAGEFDEAIKKLLKTAPDHAELTMWHEAAAPPQCGPNNKYARYAPKSIGGTATDGNWMTAKNLRDGHAHLRKLCAGNPDRSGLGHHVDYGQIFIGPANQHQVGGWIAGGLDWYGVDIYDNKLYWKNPNETNLAKTVLSQSAINARMTSNKTFLDGIAKGYKLNITETNSHVAQHRKNWALYLSEWMSDNGGYRFEWFYHAGGSLSGPYSGLEPGTRKYIAEKIIPVYGKRT